VSTSDSKTPRFTFVRELGQGGFGKVQLFHDSLLDRLVAIKLLKPADGDATDSQLKREAQALAGLQHNNVVTVYELTTEYQSVPDESQGTIQKPFGIVMEYVDGGTLQDFVKTRGRLAEPQAISLMSQAAAGLEYVHRRTPHRDLCPKNILLTSSGQPKLADFGLSLPGQNGGKHGYMAPEVRQKTADQLSDIYSFGVCLYFVLTGLQPPRQQPLPDFSGSEHLRRVVRTATMNDPRLRYQNASELLAALQPPLPPRSLPAPPEETISRRTGKMVRFEWSAASATDDDLDRLTDFPRLKDMNMPRHLSQNLQLRTLKLTAPGFTDKAILQIIHLSELEVLDLSRSSITDEGLRLLAGHRKTARLKQLFLECCGISDHGLQFLSGFPIESLHLGRTRVTDAGLHSLIQLPRLQEVAGLKDTCVTAAGLQLLRQRLPSLHVR